MIKVTKTAQKLMKNNTKSSGNRMQNTVSNYKTRLKNIGIKPEDVEDTRNPLEKLLNLEKDQNALFDIFEILGRPQNALFTGIDKALSGGSFGEGLKEGITGETKTTGKDLLLNHTNLEDEEGKINLVDVLGLGVDIVADPLDYILAPVKVANTAADVAKATDAARLAGKSADEISAIVKAAEKGTHTAWRPASEAIMRYAGKGVKKAAGAADKALEFGLGKMDASYMKRLEKVAKQRDIPIEQLIEDLGKSDKLGAYKDIKNKLSGILDSSKKVDGLVEKARQSQGAANYGTSLQKQIRDTFAKDSEDAIQKYGLNADEYYRNMTYAVNANRDLSIKGDRILSNLGKDATFVGTQKNAEDVVKLLKDNGVNAVITNGKKGNGIYVKVTDNRKIGQLQKNDKIKDLFSKLELQPEQLSDEAQALSKQAVDYFKQNPELQAMYQRGTNLVDDLNKAATAGSDLDVTNLASSKGYVTEQLSQPEKVARQTEGASYRPSSNKAFGSQQEKNIAEANLRRQEARQTASENYAKAIETRQKKVYAYDEILDDEGNVVDTVFKTDADGNKILSDNYYNEQKAKHQKNIVSMKESKKAVDDAIKAIKSGENVKLEGIPKKFQNAITNFTKKQDNIRNLTAVDMSTIKDPDVLEQINSAMDNLNKATNQLVRTANKGKLTPKIAENFNSAMNQVDVANAMVNGSKQKAVLNALKDADTLYKEGLTQGQKLAKESYELGSKGDDLNTLLQSLSDLSSSYTSKINYENVLLDNLDADDIRNKTLENISRLTEAKQAVDSKLGQDLFETNFLANIDTYIDKSNRFIADAKTYNEALALGMFADGSKYIKLEDTLDGTERNFIAINGGYLSKKLDNLKGVLPENSTLLKELSEKYKGKTLYVDRDAARVLKLFTDGKEQASGFTKLLNSFNNTYKRFKTLTPGFHLRNITGNATNMVLSGMPAAQVPIYMTKATNILNQSDEIMRKVAQGLPLTESEEFAADLIKQFHQAGFSQAGTKLQNLEDLRDAVDKGSTNLAGKALNKVSEVSMKGNELIDSLSRMSLLMYANDNPKYLQKLGVDNAAQAVKFALMDPSNMDDIEKNVLKKIIPFYTFTKQNLMFQATNLMKNTPKYRNLIKGINSMYNDLDEDSYYDYQKESMQIPLPFANDDGNQMFLKTNLPVSDLGEWLSNPLQRLVSSTSPLIKTPYEMVTGVNTFTGQPNNYTAAADFANALGIQMSPGVEDATGLAEQILSGLGVDTLTTNNLKKVTNIIENGAGNKSGNALWSEIFRSVLQNTNQEKVQNSKLYEQYEAYQEYVRRLKNQGIDVPEIREITASNKNKLNNLKNKRANSK